MTTNVASGANGAALQETYTTVVRKVDPTTFTLPTSISSPDPITSSSKSDSAAITEAATLLLQDLPIAFPTETVYGLGALATSPTAISKIYLAKGRPSDNPLIVHISSLTMLSQILPPDPPLPLIYQDAIQKYWPGPLTILLPRGPQIPLSVTGGSHQTVAVRFPSHPIALSLISTTGIPLAAPSANTSGRPSPTLASHVLQDLSTRIPLILDGGPSNCGVESTVLDGLRSPPAILRPGGVTWEQLRECKGLENLQVYKRDFEEKGLEVAPTTPGMKYRHYSPEAEVVLFEVGCGCDGGGSEGKKEAVRVAVEKEMKRLRLAFDSNVKIGIMRTWSSSTSNSSSTSSTSRSDEAEIEEYNLGQATTPDIVARELFKGLRELEGRGAKIILVEGIEEDHEGLAVMNRLRKAASRVISC